MEKFRKEILKHNVLYTVLTNPKVYLSKLVSRTLYVGAVTFVLCWTYTHTDLREMKIPSSMHSLVGVVIGLLLVFRTNTAYDRWWEGRRCIGEINNAVSFLNSKMVAYDVPKKDVVAVRKEISQFLDNLKTYLKVPEDEADTKSFHESQMACVMRCIKLLRKVKASEGSSSLENLLHSALNASNACERIKNTPIPLAYSLHIKVSILIYLITLPFGLFADLGLWSTVMVMVVYFMIAGIEIISSEIENPFAGDPNDLPVDSLVGGVNDSLNSDLTV